MAQSNDETIQFERKFRAASDVAMAQAARTFGVTVDTLRQLTKSVVMSSVRVATMPACGRSWTDDMLEAGREHQSS